MDELGAYIREIFSSVQGEGLYVGCRQIFIRFEGCNLSCRYCDTVKAGEKNNCSVEVEPGKRSFVELANPMSVKHVLDAITAGFRLSLHHSVSVTGGEPLMQAGFLKELLPAAKRLGIPVYLETNGSLPQKLNQIINFIDIVSMDIKLPGTTGCPPLWEEHAQFLSIARNAQVFVKIVVDNKSDVWEFKKALDLMAGIDKGVPLVIQPVTVDGRCVLSPDRALELQEMALGVIKDVRIIPQVHIMMNQL